jgi:hypothetical protein
MSGEGDTVEIKYRAFIPSPALKGPFFDNYHGDGRDFSYSGGTSRGEITFLVDLSPGGGLSNLRIVDRHWSPTHSYSASDTSPVSGKPDWWLDLNAGASPTGTGTCPANDDTLRAYLGAPGTMRNVLATAEMASICSIYMSGNNPLVTGSPAIDADVSVLLRRTSSGIEAKAYGSHDGFPAHELYVNGQRIHHYDPVDAGNGPTALLPPEDRDVDTRWTTVPSRGGATAQGLGVGRAFSGGRTLVFRDVPGTWRTVDFPRVTLTAVSWSDAPDAPVAFAFFGHPNIDFDGSPTAYHPDDTGDDNLANARDDQRWFGVVALSPNDAAVTSGRAIIDQRPGLDRQGRYPVIQRAENGDANPGYYVSQTSRAADASLPRYVQARYLDASRVPYGALSGKLKDQGVALGDYGLTVRHDRNLQSGFFMADSGGNNFALGEGSQKVGTNLGGSGRGNHFNNNFPVSFLVFPGTATTGPTDPPPSESDINQNVTAVMSQLCLADNARDLALLMALNEVAPGNQPRGKAALDAFLAKGAGATPPRNYQTIVDGLRNFNFNVREPQAEGQAYRSAYAGALDAGDWSINWDEVYPVGQPTNVSCWATAAAMIDGWRRRQSVSIDSIAEFDNLSTQNGLPPSSAARFAEAIGFSVHPNACYTPEGFRDILEANGPIWVAAKVPGLHAIVATGMYRENGRYYVRITDPWDRVVGLPGQPGAYASTHTTGSQYILTYDQFATEFELAGMDRDFAQLLHTGGAHGHAINRGSASGAGYAQALEGGDDRLGPGTSLTRRETTQTGRRYDLAQLSGMVAPNMVPAVAVTPMPGQRVVLSDWPYVEGAGGRTQAPVAIDWQYGAGCVGNIAIAPADGQVFDGWTVAVKADICPGASRADRAELKVRVMTTFMQGQTSEVAVSEVTLTGDGRASTQHGADQAPAEPILPSLQSGAPAGNGAATDPQLVTA